MIFDLVTAHEDPHRTVVAFQQRSSKIQHQRGLDKCQRLGADRLDRPIDIEMSDEGDSRLVVDHQVKIDICEPGADEWFLRFQLLP
ncbi:hypothetical protein SDC9_130490 [bioreactor metagenome]|uniref:Uncharacterized protein n=1 Tax=bioreactor metagenome TaxID=1076179 RepID=A0A645D233_9ZZZZ